VSDRSTPFDNPQSLYVNLSLPPPLLAQKSQSALECTHNFRHYEQRQLGSYQAGILNHTVLLFLREALLRNLDISLPRL